MSSINECRGHDLHVVDGHEVDDVDDVNDLEPICDWSKPCNFNLTCANGKCLGANAKYNMNSFYMNILPRLLPRSWFRSGD